MIDWHMDAAPPSTTGSTAAAVPLVTPRRTVGTSDMVRVAAGMNALIEADDRQGRNGVLELQHRNADERIRRALHALATEYTIVAAWSCIDARTLDQAKSYLNESATYVGLSPGRPNRPPVTTVREEHGRPHDRRR